MAEDLADVVVAAAAAAPSPSVAAVAAAAPPLVVVAIVPPLDVSLHQPADVPILPIRVVPPPAVVAVAALPCAVADAADVAAGHEHLHHEPLLLHHLHLRLELRRINYPHFW